MSKFSRHARDEHVQPPSAAGPNGPATGGGSWYGQAPPPQGASFYPSPYAVRRAPHRRRMALRVTGGVLVVSASMAAGVGLGTSVLGSRSPAAPTAVAPNNSAGSSAEGGGGYGSGLGSGSGSSGGSGLGGGYGSGQYGQPSSPNETGATSTLPRATAAQEVGVVDIDTVLAYQGADAAGTGMVLTSSGEVLTNNHVVDGATSVKVTVVSTGASYSAKVVGTDPTQDVAVLQLQGASGLQTVRTDSSAVTTSEKVSGVGNAGGVGGVPNAASGKVTATGTALTATDQDGSNPETLHGMIQDDTAIQAGDSGGPLYNTAGQVVGMDTAAQATRAAGTAAGYAIPIGSALQVARQIESGTASSTVHQGYPAFLGVSLSRDQSASVSGAVVQQVLVNTPAVQAGMTAGDVITAIGTRQITSPSAVASALATHQPGQQVTVTWADQRGQSHNATVSLAVGPAD